VRRELERVEIPGEHEARERARAVVLASLAARQPIRRRRSLRPVVALVAATALVAAVVSPTGRSVIDSVRERVGVEGAAPALFTLPSDGRLLVGSTTGAWIVQPDGSKRLLGDYREAAWSPFGNYVVATRRNELVTLDPQGALRWSLARPAISRPSWGGSRTDTRIAYLSGSTLRVVAGDGTGDRIVARGIAPVAPVWLPRAPHALTYATREGRLITVSLQTGRELWRTARGKAVERLEWSTDGRRLLVRRGGNVEIRDRTGSPFTGIRPADGAISAATFRPGSHAVAYVTLLGGRSRVSLLDEPSRTLLTVAGAIAQLAWSPDGTTILVPWGEADQWLFIPRRGGKLRAVDAIASQFEGFPRTVSWCCAS